MALRVPKSTLPQLFKDGYKFQQGIEEAVLRNIDATHELSEVVRTSMGPNGRNKMIINHLEKLFVTNDAATIIRELDVVHPAAKLLVMASQQQENELGDNTNLILVFAGELLQKAADLLKLGLHPSEIVQGYELARDRALSILEELSVGKIESLTDRAELNKLIKATISSKQYGYEDFLGELVCEAALNIMPKNVKDFNIDNVRVVKVMGSSIHESRVVRGMVFGREPEGIVQKAQNAKVAVFTCPLDISQTETKGTVLIHNAQEMLNFSKDEEKQVEKIFQDLAEAGVKVVVTGNGIGELCLHYLNRYNIMAVKVLSKFDLRRLCRVIGATALARLGTPMAEEMGQCDIVETVEIGSDRVTVFRQEEAEKSRTTTIVIRGATQNHMDDIERAIDDGVNVIKAATRNPLLLAGAGAVEMELNKRLQTVASKTPGLNQHAIKKFAEALEVIPRTLCENAGMEATAVLSRLYAAHYQEGDVGISVGVDVENENDGTLDATKAHIFDSLASKYSAYKLASDAAITVLRVDQIIMSKPAGGPKPLKKDGHWDEDD
ncbi:T-complex protein 1 theta subunit [Gilbertella persicaria]|uniref:T-complex protein 1 theta subunit n=1 Tax=Gilbertella persicaria TaxID=101096 RepID=UPI00221EEDCA|nr:T-complex protein 1 theta subunit [Gilbertella persicaria]KAI8092130.1 T-complex protein 1 theta subunit [Gilbertella persicaria]